MWTNDVQVLLCKDTQDVCAIIIEVDKRQKILKNRKGLTLRHCFSEIILFDAFILHDMWKVILIHH